MKEVLVASGGKFHRVAISESPESTEMVKRLGDLEEGTLNLIGVEGGITPIVKGPEN